MSWLQTPLLLTRLQAVGWIAAAVMLALVAGTWTGYRVGHEGAAAQGEAALAQLKLQHALDRELDAADYATRRQEMMLVAFKLADDLQAARDAHAADKAAANARISHVTTHYRPALDAPAVPLPACVFTTGFVRVYDASIGVPEPVAAADPDAGSDEAPGATDPTEELGSGITQADILQHIGAYGQRCRDIESQLNTVLDAVERQQGEAQ